MAKQSAADPAALHRLAQNAAESRAPARDWNPPFCGDIDMRVARDGTWFYAGSPITRMPLVRLFASVLRREPDGFMLVTPVEKVRITVDDAPFAAVEVAGGPGAALRFRTNLEDWVEAGDAHPLRFAPAASGGSKPYLTVRPGLEALATRAVYLELVDRGEVRGAGREAMFGVASGPAFFPIAPASALDDAIPDGAA